ncbi:MAG: methyltransferase domain-containing protein [Saprospiraceae bacterium]|nr:methyltransferase domain-containing protein [Saprospiraceae bacterium]
MMNKEENSTSETSGLKNKIISYYDETWLEYRLIWINKQNRALHFGYFQDGIQNHNDALVNLNQVMADKVNIGPNDKVLDAGCGQGGSAMWMAEHIGCEVVGVTIVPHQVIQAKRESLQRKIEHKTSFEVKDYCHTGFADNSFSVVWACESICHAAQKADFYKEALRVLKPGGRLIVAEYIRNKRPFGIEEEKVLHQWCSGWSMPDLDTWEEHTTNMKLAGFTSISHEDVTTNIEPSLGRLYRVSKRLLKLGRFLHYIKIRNKVKHGNQLASISQYEALSMKLWHYSLFSARKPEN